MLELLRRNCRMYNCKVERRKIEVELRDLDCLDKLKEINEDLRLLKMSSALSKIKLYNIFIDNNENKRVFSIIWKLTENDSVILVPSISDRDKKDIFEIQISCNDLVKKTNIEQLNQLIETKLNDEIEEIILNSEFLTKYERIQLRNKVRENESNKIVKIVFIEQSEGNDSEEQSKDSDIESFEDNDNDIEQSKDNDNDIEQSKDIDIESFEDNDSEEQSKDIDIESFEDNDSEEQSKDNDSEEQSKDNKKKFKYINRLKQTLKEDYRLQDSEIETLINKGVFSYKCEPFKFKFEIVTEKELNVTVFEIGSNKGTTAIYKYMKNSIYKNVKENKKK